MVWQLLKIVGKAVKQVAKFVRPCVEELIPIPITKDYPILADRKNDIELAKLKLQYVQQSENQQFQAKQLEKSQNFQAEIAKLSQEKAKELQEFIQRAEDARLQKTLDFQQWRLEQEKALQLELLELNQQFQRELVTYQRQTSLKVVEEQKRLENSPVWLVAADILNSHPENEIMPLRVFFAPPKVQFERFANAANATQGFPDIELTVAEGLRQFFRNYSIQGRQLDFLAGAWVSKTFHSEASIKALFGVLKSEPTLVLESEVDGDYLNFRIAYWGLNWSKYRYDPIISRLPYRDILYEAAKTRARKWQETKTKLINAGVSAEEVDKLYGADNAKNLVLLQLEERFKQAGIDSGDLELDYTINKKDFEELCQFLIIYHCLFAGLVADEYFLFQYNLTPLLPQLLPELTQNVPDTEAVQEMIEAVVLYYQNVYQALESQRSSLVPELNLELAQSLANLPNKTWAKGRIIDSMKAWLKLRELTQPDEFEDLLKAVESVLKIADLAYVQKLNDCLVAVGEKLSLSVKDACYNRGMSRCHKGEYEEAIKDFDQAIEINSNWAEAFYNRGLAYGKLAEYHKAIEDYTRALEINSHWADVYNNRGNAYYKLGDYEKAIADYDAAIKINPELTAAIKNRDITQGVWDELKRQKEQEEEPKTKWENFTFAQTLTAHSDYLRSVLISPDGKTLFSASDDKTIKIWELSTGKLVRTLTGHTHYIYALAISPDGKTLFSAGAENNIKIWELSTGKVIRILSGHFDTIYALAINPDGQTLVSASNDKTIRIWQWNTGQLNTIAGHSGGIFTLAITPDGKTLVSGSDDKTIKIWELNSGREIRTLKGHSSTVCTLAISPDGQTLISGSDDNTIKIWQLSTGKEIRTITGHNDCVRYLIISRDGQTIISGSADKNIKIWELSTGKEICKLTGHSGIVFSLAISPEQQTLVSGSGDKTIKIWRVV
ncbi:tetratricopeptide repeat protein [Floridanema aerugineum]|uniref:Tetratricopeptide repeat protein n=1 Tax=Floridaenema aerugineum BLCC-F46 TaxID=3153654 RepID=A0ABV4X4M2_9CYAN